MRLGGLGYALPRLPRNTLEKYSLNAPIKTNTIFQTASSCTLSTKLHLHPQNSIINPSNNSLNSSALNYHRSSVTIMAQEMRKSLISLKNLIKKLQNHLHHSRRIDTSSREFKCDEFGTNERVPDDVKEGQFAILAKDEDDKPTRFVVGLCLLKHPDFLKLLKMAEEEYGFQQRGALAVPCRPEELERILQGKTWKRTKQGQFMSIVC